MIWSEGFTASYYITLVDPKTWRDVRRMEITGGSVSRSADGLLQSADIDLTELPGSGEAWIRIYLDAEQGSTEHVPLFTGLTSSPARDIDGRREKYRAECYSVLKPADDVLTERGYYVAAEVPAPQAVARLLSVGPAPVEVEDVANPPRLTESVIAEDGETNLSLVRKVLDAIGWRIRIDGRGMIHIERPPESAAICFDAMANDVIELSLSEEYDWYSAPNIFRAVSGDMTAIARDDDPESPLSTISRGREIWAEDSSARLGSNESLAAYAFRRLKELQSPARNVSYKRRFDPNINVGDIVRINHPAIGISGFFRIGSQDMDLTFGCRTSETASEVKK